VSLLVEKFNEYSEWRQNLLSALEKYRDEVQVLDLADAASTQRFSNILHRIADDKLSIAFVSEFSRGKSELINAIFFADYGKRILPSSAGRTTMCPTELMYDETFPPSIRLLPIETRASSQSTSDFKSQGNVWKVLPLDVGSPDGMLEAFKQVSLTKRVTIDEAKSYGLYDETDTDAALSLDENGMAEISQWRHAIVNFPHPLLKQGLVILDTPGLNAIGTEPELTLNLIPNAHAVLFILAADTGVTKSDIEVWHDHIGSGMGRLVVLNKIDSMWDELRSPEEVERQINSQCSQVAQLLALDQKNIFPVSAQKGLVAKINQDKELLGKSRMLDLEYALSHELIPFKMDIIRNQLSSEIAELAESKRTLLASRARGSIEQLFELKSLRGKNSNVIQHMMNRLEEEKKDFDGSLKKLQGTRAVFTRLSTEVFTSLGMDILKESITQTRDEMHRCRFSAGIREAVRQFFVQARHNLELSNLKVEEILQMMTVMYRKFSSEHGLALTTPMPFSMEKYQQELNLIESVYQKQFGASALLTTSRMVLMQQFFDSIVSRVKLSYQQANRDVDAWLKVIMAPLEAQIREHREQMKNRLQSVQRIHLAIGSLEEKIASFEQTKAGFDEQKKKLAEREEDLRLAITNEQPEMVAAA